jgi:outer membrane protein OmpA-like peptidoglycan-associated protein
VSVVGYTDSAGTAPADFPLSQRRAQTVADALMADGVAANRLVRSGRGQTGENPGLASRRVEVALAANCLSLRSRFERPARIGRL